MKDWTIQRRVTLGIGLVLAFASILAGASLAAVRSIRSAVADVDGDAVPALPLAAHIQALREERIGLIFQHILSTDPEEIDAAQRGIERNAEALASQIDAYRGRHLSGAGARDLGRFLSDQNKFDAAQGRLLELSRQNKNIEALEYYYREMAPLAAAMEQDAGSLCGHAGEDPTRAMRLGQNVLFFLASGATAMLLLGACVTWGISATLARTLSRLSGEMRRGASAPREARTIGAPGTRRGNPAPAVG